MNTQIFTYNDSAITFQQGESVMVNATEMAKAFGKSPNHWLRNQSTKEFLTTYSTLRNRNLEEIVKTINGGDKGNGTWLHEDVALEFARWLSPAFALWCNDRIKELLTTGHTAINFDDPDTILMLASKWKEERSLRIEAEQKALQLENLNKAQKPKVAFADAMLASTTSCLIGELAKVLTQNGYTIGQNRLFNYLRNEGYLCKAGERRNQPKQEYIEQGIFEIKHSTRSGNDGVQHITCTTKVTPKGQQFFINKFIC